MKKKNGGWRGGDVSMTCRYDGAVYAASITSGRARLTIDGQEQPLIIATETPWGLAVSRHAERDFVTYAFAFEKREMAVLRFKQDGSASLPSAEDLANPVTVACD